MFLKEDLSSEGEEPVTMSDSTMSPFILSGDEKDDIIFFIETNIRTFIIIVTIAVTSLILFMISIYMRQSKHTCLAVKNICGHPERQEDCDGQDSNTEEAMLAYAPPCYTIAVDMPRPTLDEKSEKAIEADYVKVNATQTLTKNNKQSIKPLRGQIVGQVSRVDSSQSLTSVKSKERRDSVISSDLSLTLSVSGLPSYDAAIKMLQIQESNNSMQILQPSLRKGGKNKCKESVTTVINVET